MKSYSLENQKQLIDAIEPTIANTGRWLIDSYERLAGASLKGSSLDHLVHRKFGKLHINQIKYLAYHLSEHEGRGINPPRDDLSLIITLLGLEGDFVRQLMLAKRYLQKGASAFFNKHFYAFKDGYIAYGYLISPDAPSDHYRFELRELESLSMTGGFGEFPQFDIDTRVRKIKKLKKYCRKAGVDILTIRKKLIKEDSGQGYLDIYTNLDWDSQPRLNLGRPDSGYSRIFSFT